MPGVVDPQYLLIELPIVHSTIVLVCYVAASLWESGKGRGWSGRPFPLFQQALLSVFNPLDFRMPLFSFAANAVARGPIWTAAAPTAAEVCSI